MNNMGIKEEVAFVSGMMEGMNLDMNTNEAKLFDAIIGVLQDMALVIEENREDFDDLNKFVDDMDSDLHDVEEILNLCDDDECCCDDEDDEECDCGCCHHHDVDDEDECDCGDCEDCLVDVKCPNCGETVCFDPAVLWDEDGDVEVLCPNCDAVVFSSDMVGDDCEVLDDDPETENTED